MHVNRCRVGNGRIAVGMSLTVILAAPAAAQVTGRVSVDSNGVQANGDNSTLSSVTPDGRHVVFGSYASNLVNGDSNSVSDVFVRDRLLGITERVSVDSTGVQANLESYRGSISADGRYVAFDSRASNLVAGDTNGAFDVFVRDRQLGTTERVSVDSAGGQVDGGDSSGPSISADGRYVAFHSSATNLVAGDTNGFVDVFVHDRVSGSTQRVSVSSAGAQASEASYSASITPDGRWVVFSSVATDLVGGDTNGVDDVFVHDRLGGTTVRASLGSAGAEGNGDTSYTPPAISADGRFVAFGSAATNLVGGDTNGTDDIFVRDLVAGTTERSSVSTAGAQASQWSGAPSISADGRYVAFETASVNLVGGDTNLEFDVFVRDRQAGTTQRVSVTTTGGQANQASYIGSLSPDGRFVSFQSLATNLVPGDTNGFADVFVRDREYKAMSNLCEPGAGGVIACPCSNPPGAPGRGCNNSSALGGAFLTATGGAFLSQDTLVFTTSGQVLSSTSILVQGSTPIASGVVYGQGVRCLGGTLKRLYTRTSAGGGITAPVVGLGDPTVSTRSAAIGDPILPGQSRGYFVYYRDPIVPGGCPAAATFNATQTGEVTWLP